MIRRRMWVALALAGVVAAGVASRTVMAGVPLVGKELGGVLWAAMFYLIAVLILPGLSPAAAATVAFAAAAGTEFSQLYKAPWIDGLRSTRGGGLLLGHAFAWKDIACYGVGAAAGWALDMWVSSGQGRKARSG
jgi:hypothetical protein